MWTELTGEQIGQERMRFFERLKAAASAEWRVYTEHPFTNGMADGLLAEAAFRHYLVQDYLFLIEFARAYALAVYKAAKLADMREAAAGLSAILERERPDALFVAGDAFFLDRRVQFATLTARDRIPAAYSVREPVAAGGLMSYGPDIADAFRQASIPAASSRAPSPPNCRCCSRPNSSLSSTFKRRERSASRCRQRCSPSPMR
jgi:hypothetical protein